MNLAAVGPSRGCAPMERMERMGGVRRVSERRV